MFQKLYLLMVASPIVVAIHFLHPIIMSAMAHLHFGVSQGKKWVNPLPYVKGAKKVAAPKISQKKKVTYTKKINTTKRVSR